MKIKTTLLTADKPSLNNRIYKKEALVNAVNAFKQCEPNLVCANSMDNIIDTASASHRIVDLEMVGDNLVATVEFLDTPKGKDLQRAIEVLGEENVEGRASGVEFVDDEYRKKTGESIIRKDYRLTSVVFVPKED